MKKQLNVDIIQSELRGGSAFFPGYRGGRSPAPSPALETQSVARAPEKPTKVEPDAQGVPPPVPRPVPGTVPRTAQLIPRNKRPIKQRQPFDIYEDQYARLRQIADSERGFINGRSMSQMVRDAIDAYLATTASTDKK